MIGTWVNKCFVCLSDLSRWRPLPPLERLAATSESVAGQLLRGVFQTPRDTDRRQTGAGQRGWRLNSYSDPAQASLQPNMQTPPLHPTLLRPHGSSDGFSWASAWTTPLNSDWLIGSRKESEWLGDKRTSGGTWWTISYSQHHTSSVRKPAGLARFGRNSFACVLLFMHCWQKALRDDSTIYRRMIGRN